MNNISHPARMHKRNGHLIQAGVGGIPLLVGATEAVALLRQRPMGTGLCKGIVVLSENRQRSVCTSSDAGSE